MATKNLTLAEVLKLLKKHGILIFAFSFIVFCCVYAINSYYLPPVYEARATIMSKSSRSASSLDALMGQIGAAAGLGGIINAAGGVQSETQQFSVMLKSARIMRSVAADPEVARGFLGRDIDQSRLEQDLNAVVIKIRRGLSVRLETGTLHLTFQGKSAEHVYRVTDLLIKSLQEFLNNNIVTQSKNAEVFIRERLTELNQDVERAERDLVLLRTGRKNVEGPRSLQSEILRKEREFARLNGILDLLSQQYELSQIESKRSDPMFLLVDPPLKPLYPVGPKKMDNSLVGFVAALVLSILGLLAWKRLQDLFD